MKRIGLFIDVNNIYYSLIRKHNKKLDYEAYYKYVADLGEITQALIYGTYDESVRGFLTRMRTIGFLAKYKESPSPRHRVHWHTGICMDVVNMIDRLDMVVIGCADPNIEPLLTWIRSRGVDAVVFASCINHILKESVTQYIEIPESMLEQSATKKEQLDAAPETA